MSAKVKNSHHASKTGHATKTHHAAQGGKRKSSASDKAAFKHKMANRGGNGTKPSNSAHTNQSHGHSSTPRGGDHNASARASQGSNANASAKPAGKPASHSTAHGAGKSGPSGNGSFTHSNATFRGSEKQGGGAFSATGSVNNASHGFGSGSLADTGSSWDGGSGFGSGGFASPGSSWGVGSSFGSGGFASPGSSWGGGTHFSSGGFASPGSSWGGGTHFGSGGFASPGSSWGGGTHFGSGSFASPRSSWGGSTSFGSGGFAGTGGGWGRKSSSFGLSGFGSTSSNWGGKSSDSGTKGKEMADAGDAHSPKFVGGRAASSKSGNNLGKNPAAAGGSNNNPSNSGKKSTNGANTEANQGANGGQQQQPQHNQGAKGKLAGVTLKTGSVKTLHPGAAKPHNGPTKTLHPGRAKPHNGPTRTLHPGRAKPHNGPTKTLHPGQAKPHNGPTKTLHPGQAKPHNGPTKTLHAGRAKPHNGPATTSHPGARGQGNQSNQSPGANGGNNRPDRGANGNHNNGSNPNVSKPQVPLTRKQFGRIEAQTAKRTDQYAANQPDDSVVKKEGGLQRAKEVAHNPDNPVHDKINKHKVNQSLNEIDNDPNQRGQVEKSHRQAVADAVENVTGKTPLELANEYDTTLTSPKTQRYLQGLPAKQRRHFLNTRLGEEAALDAGTAARTQRTLNGKKPGNNDYLQTGDVPFKAADKAKREARKRYYRQQDKQLDKAYEHWGEHAQLKMFHDGIDPGKNYLNHKGDKRLHALRAQHQGDVHRMEYKAGKYFVKYSKDTPKNSAVHQFVHTLDQKLRSRYAPGNLAQDLTPAERKGHYNYEDNKLKAMRHDPETWGKIERVRRLAAKDGFEDSNLNVGNKALNDAIYAAFSNDEFGKNVALTPTRANIRAPLDRYNFYPLLFPHGGPSSAPGFRYPPGTGLSAFGLAGDPYGLGGDPDHPSAVAAALAASDLLNSFEVIF